MDKKTSTQDSTGKKKPGVIIYDDYIHFFRDLPPQQSKDLIVAVLEYHRTGKEPELDLATQLAFNQIRLSVDRDRVKYTNTCKRNSENIRKRWDTTLYDRIQTNTKHTDKDKDKDKEERVSVSDSGSDTDSKPSRYSDAFEKFWAVYPNKKGKGGAWKAFQKADTPPIEELIAIVRKQKHQEQWTKDSGKFIPHPQTWLNQNRWEDEVESKPVRFVGWKEVWRRENDKPFKVWVNKEGLTKEEWLCQL